MTILIGIWDIIKKSKTYNKYNATKDEGPP